ncbi:MAG: radical SAM protein [Candidatus Omnitrophota bacterium]
MKIALISTDESRVGMGVKTLSACLIGSGFDTVTALLPTTGNSLKGTHWADLNKICSGAGLICISCMTHGVSRAVEVKNKLQETTRSPIIVGGIHASLDPESLRGNFELICSGEGEDAIVELASRIKNKEAFYDIPGLIGNWNGKVFNNPAQPLSKDLNNYPFPDYDLSRQYILESGRIIPMSCSHIDLNHFVILGSRGCPHSCSYCSNYKLKQDFPWRRLVRHYSVDYLINHLKKASESYPQIRSFWLEDDTFFAKELDEIKEFSARYKEEVNKPFLILISPWTYCREKVELLIEAGMSGLIMGIQSGSENTNRNIYERRISNSKVLEITASLNKFSGVSKYYDFIGMNPFEGRQDLVDTIRFIKRLPQPFFIFNNNLAFYPGTRLHEKALKLNLDISKRDKHADANIGYLALRREKIGHKFFHFLLLMMAGSVNKWRVGFIPRFMVSGPAMRMYVVLDRRAGFLMNWAVSNLSLVFMYLDWKFILKRIFSRKQLNKLKIVYEYFKPGQSNPKQIL